MNDEDRKGNVTRLPLERTDRVAKLAGAISKVMELSDADSPEDHLTALMLVQAAVQQAVMREEGPAGLRRVLVNANERRKKYQIRWAYSPRKDGG